MTRRSRIEFKYSCSDRRIIACYRDAMAVFLLHPTREGLQDSDWNWSAYRGACLVVAENAERARLYAAGAFMRPLMDSPSGGATPTGHPGTPWLQRRLVIAFGTSITLDACVPCGSVIAPGHDCPYLRLEQERAAHRDGAVTGRNRMPPRNLLDEAVLQL